ncbi:hypothetical protein EfmAA290_22370 [Enterococcus faecium]|nr:hypothetical protein EfmAA290_22370 [Enterococcus faecium]
MDELAELPLEAFCDLLQEKGKGRFKQPEKIAKAIQRAITMSYRLGALAQESINVVLSVLVREIRALEKNIKELDKAIEQVIVVIPEYQCLTSIPGVGKVYAAGLIAEIGQIERFEDQTKLAKYAGLSWKVNQSGNYQSQNTPLTKLILCGTKDHANKPAAKRLYKLSTNGRLLFIKNGKFQSINTNVHSS